MLGLGALLRAVPIWGYVLAAALLWGGVHRYKARAAVRALETAVAESAAAHNRQLKADAEETSRRLSTQAENARNAEKTASLARRAESDARADLDRLRRQAAADRAAADARTRDTAAEQLCAPTRAERDVYAGLFFSAAETAGAMAAEAERYRTSGQLCVDDYDALMKR